MERNLRKERIGVVVSDKMDKTIVVSVEIIYQFVACKSGKVTCHLI